MFSYIKGIVEEVQANYIVVENNGIGYKFNVSANVQMNVEKGTKAKIYTKMIVREDDISLCGFYSEEERKMFELLTSVSKVGPKVALSILSFADVSKLTLYILTDDTKSISKASGVGKKTAERIVLELKDKVDKSAIEDVEGDLFGETMPVTNNSNEKEEAIAALVALGYSIVESDTVVSEAFKKNKKLTTEEAIKLSLKLLMGSKF